MKPIYRMGRVRGNERCSRKGKEEELRLIY